MAMKPVEEQLADALRRVPQMGKQELLSVRGNALRHPEIAQPLLQAIDEALKEFEATGGMAVHRLEFARCMLRKLEREPIGRRVAGRDLFNRACREDGDNPYAIWMQGNSARQIPLTKALEDVLPDFPNVRREKEGTGRSDRVTFFRVS